MGRLLRGQLGAGGLRGQVHRRRRGKRAQARHIAGGNRQQAFDLRRRQIARRSRGPGVVTLQRIGSNRGKFGIADHPRPDCQRQRPRRTGHVTRMGRSLRCLKRAGRLACQVDSRSGRQRPQTRHIRCGQSQPVIGRTGEFGPRHLGQPDVPQGHRRSAACGGVVELERQPHHRIGAQRRDRHRIDRRELNHIGLEARRGIQPGVGAAQHLLYHRRRAAAAVVLQRRRDLLQNPSRRGRLHLECQPQRLAQPFHRKRHVLIPALRRSGRANGNPGVVLPDRTIGILQPVHRDRPGGAAQRPLVRHFLRAAGHRCRG